MNGGESYIDYPVWLKMKKVTKNPKDKNDNMSFKYAVAVSLNHEKIEKDPQRILKIKPRGKTLEDMIFLYDFNNFKKNWGLRCRLLYFIVELYK